MRCWPGAPAMAAPPVEAQKQADGSFVLPQEDGSTLRWTRRPDGTWRRPEHRKAGYVGELEQAKYVSPGAKIEQNRQAQMKPQEDEDDFQATKASRRNERKKEQRREKAEAKEEQRIEAQLQPEEQAAAPAAAPAKQAPAIVEDAPKKDAAAEGAARQRAIEKKLRQIADLEAKRAKGEELNEDQCAKVVAKCALQAELKSLISGVPMEEPAPKVAAAAPEAPPEAEVPVPVEPPKAEAPKSKKAIEKKLRQIAEIEQKQAAGEELNPDQLAKLEAKKALQKELKVAV